MSTNEADLEILARNRQRRTFGAGEVLRDGEDGVDKIFLLSSGQATLAAETPFGPHPIAVLKAPALLNLKRAISGPQDLYRILPGNGSEAVLFSTEEARSLLFAPGPVGQAFRRLALSSVAAGLRETNLAVAKFFDSLSANAKSKSRESGVFTSMATPVPVNAAQVYDLFDAAGLNPSGLPDLGLVARSLPSEAALMKARTPGDEAFLLAEGRLRVSIKIPGVGEEALAILGPGEIVGEMALIDDAPRSADVIAHEGTALVYVLSRPVFRRLLDSGDPAGAPLLAGITVALTRRHEEVIRKAAGFRVLTGPF
ncbi:MAG: cyclic nucleotide-binding domain-containing protein [Thermoanaerobaculia bacterium]